VEIVFLGGLFSATALNPVVQRALFHQIGFTT
jgi:Cu/Ag efflux pump CusA